MASLSDSSRGMGVVKAERAWIMMPAVTVASRIALCLALMVVGPAAATSRLPLYEAITGSEHEYVVAAGDTVWSITGRFTMSRSLFETLNALSDPDRLQPGKHLRVTDRHIVPT